MIEATAPGPTPARRPRRRVWRRGLDQLSIYLPVLLMAAVALMTYWLARNTPGAAPSQAPKVAAHDPDYFMRRFSVKTFHGDGRLRSEVFGREARHYPDTDTIEIDEPRIRSFNERGELTEAVARKAISNGDGSEVQLLGGAQVTRLGNGSAAARIEFRGEFLHAFLQTERIVSHKPVQIVRGNDRLQADSVAYSHLERALELKGRARASLSPSAGR